VNRYSLVKIQLFDYVPEGKVQETVFITDNEGFLIHDMTEKHGDNFKGYSIEERNVDLVQYTK